MIRVLFIGLLLATPAHADTADDYVACLIGKAVVALHNQEGERDSGAAMEVAYAGCVEPANLDENEAEGLGDFVNASVYAIAAGVWPSNHAD